MKARVIFHDQREASIYPDVESILKTENNIIIIYDDGRTDGFDRKEIDWIEVII